MIKSLKEKSTVLLAPMFILNMGVFGWVFFGAEIDFRKWHVVLWAPFIAGILVILNGVVNSENKSRLVFWRWKNPLPGSRAFSEIAKKDPRIDLDIVPGLEYEDILNSPEKQNYVWFNCYYKLVRNDPAVMSCHRDYLFSRDYTIMSFLLLIVMSPIGYFYSEEWNTIVYYTISMLCQYLVVRYVAVNYGERFVATVLVLAETKDA